MADVKQSSAYKVVDELAGKLKVVDSVKVLVDTVIEENEKLKNDKVELQNEVDDLLLQLGDLMLGGI